MSGKKTVKKIPVQVLLSAHAKLDELMNLLKPYLVFLTPPERSSYVEMKEDYFNFIKQSYELAVEYPGLFPEFKKVSSFGENFFIVKELWVFVKKINVLSGYINDTEMLAGSDAFEMALAFYDTVRIAARHDFPAARVIYEDLKPKLPVKRRRQKTKAVKDRLQPELFD